jgi:nucleotide-binding universal stress UspA family protein
MYKTILIPLDGSKRAEAILPHAEELAKRYGTKVIFLHVIEPAQFVVGPEGAYIEKYPEVFHQLASEAEDYLAVLEETFQNQGIDTRISVCQGPAVEEILKAAEQENADIIALASHGRTGLSRVFYGSVAAGVLHRIDRPLLLIRSE